MWSKVVEKPPWLLATFEYQGGSQAYGFLVIVCKSERSLIQTVVSSSHWDMKTKPAQNARASTRGWCRRKRPNQSF
uniref:Uncharacterized protein n=1 Tax=Physcomitrium patens TaxID=3218 RepID=A0A7I4F6V1_PHYPA